MDLSLDAVLSALFGYFLIVLTQCGERVSFMGHVDLSVMLLGSQIRLHISVLPPTSTWTRDSWLSPYSRT